MENPVSVYLDHAAATPTAPEVMAAIAEAQAVAHANPSSQHALGRIARRLLEDARDRITAMLGGQAVGIHRDRLVFTSGASEANHLAIVGMASGAGAPGEIWCSRRDHPSSLRAAEAAARQGWNVREVGLAANDGTAAAALAAKAEVNRSLGPRIVTVTLGCGQTGSMEDMNAVAGLVTRANDRGTILLHVDATQVAGFMPIDFHTSPAATLALAPHKFAGPRGIGGLLIRGGVAIEPMLAGTQEQGLRGGTEAVGLAVGFARAMELACADRDQAVWRVARLRDRLEARLLEAARWAGIPAMVIAASARRCPHITTLAFPGLDRQMLAMAADLAGVCLATGTACASGSSEPAPALIAMGLPPDVVRSAVRLSVGRTTTEAEIDQAVERIAPLLTFGTGDHSPRTIPRA
jgi:cysteine desulfurase